LHETFPSSISNFVVFSSIIPLNKLLNMDIFGFHLSNIQSFIQIESTLYSLWSSFIIFCKKMGYLQICKSLAIKILFEWYILDYYQIFSLFYGIFFLCCLFRFMNLGLNHFIVKSAVLICSIKYELIFMRIFYLRW
jgi:hypothetical protein